MWRNEEDKEIGATERERGWMGYSGEEDNERCEDNQGPRQKRKTWLRRVRKTQVF